MRRALLLAVPLLVAGCSGGTTAAQSTSTSATSTSTSASSSSSTSTSTPSSHTPSPTTVARPTGNSSASSVAAVPGKGCVPTRVDVPSVGINEPIRAMGLNAQGQIYPPAHTTMWYDRSPQPGTNGVAVIAGHVEYDGPDDFYELDRVAAGSPVTVSCSNGRVFHWRVSHKESVLKTALQTDQRVWGGSSTPVVALITCDRASKVVAGHHLNNYVVWVRPA